MQINPVYGANVQQAQVMFTDIANFLAVLMTPFHRLIKGIWILSCAQVTCETKFSPLRNIKSQTEEGTD